MPADAPHSHWTAADYRPVVLGAAAAKLADSQIAPLVAAARSYRSARTVDDLERIARAFDVDTAMFSRMYAQYVGGSDDNDLLVLPWFVAAGRNADSAIPAPRTLQMRPKTAPVDPATGKAKKYLFLPGEASVVDTHPATPRSWIGSAETIVITEGVIKADAALSALLVAEHGHDALRFTGTVGAGHQAWEGDRDRAIAELSSLMEAVAPHHRTLIVGIGGVGNWHQKPEWESLVLKGRTVAVAFDGDVHTNKQVAAQAKQLDEFLTRRGANVSLIDLDGPLVLERKAERGIPDDAKIGLDDFLTRLGDWADVSGGALYAPMPERQDRRIAYREGELRVSPANQNVVEIYDIIEKTAAWRPHLNERGVFVAGRVAENRIRRMPGESESSGIIDHSLDMAAGVESTIEVTVSSSEFDPEPEAFKIVVPSKHLDTPPGDWAKQSIFIPPRLRQLGAWPPYSGRGEGPTWLRAVVTNRTEEVSDVYAWETLGWVPDGDGGMAFALGNGQLLSRTPECATAISGADSTVFPDAEKFAVADRFDELDFATWRAGLIDDLRAVTAAYIDDGPWSNKAYGVLGLAAMVRPTIPTRPKMSIFTFGPKKSGKSFWTSLVFSGWQRAGGTWTNDFLPGSANDSRPSTEDSMARTPLWVLDDMSAALSSTKRDEVESMVGDTMRAIHNSTPRRRMEMGGGQKKVPRPRCVLIVTAENELRDTSALDRTIMVSFAKGVFADNDGHARAKAMRDAPEPAPSRLVAGMIRYWLLGDRSWAERYAEARGLAERATREMSDWVAEKMPDSNAGENEREVQKMSDVLTGLLVIRSALEWLGVDESDPLMRKFSWEDGGYYAMLAGFALSGINNADANRPGAHLLEAIRDLLASKRAYISNAVVDGAPPVIASPESGVEAERASFLNRALGWEFENGRGWTHRANATEIGSAATLSDGTQAVILEPRNAFREAKANSSDLITAGQTAATTWKDFYAEGLTHPGYQRPAGGGHPKPRVGAGGYVRIRGVVVPMYRIVGEDEDEQTPVTPEAAGFEITDEVGL